MTYQVVHGFDRDGTREFIDFTRKNQARKKYDQLLKDRKPDEDIALMGFDEEGDMVWFID